MRNTSNWLETMSLKIATSIQLIQLQLLQKSTSNVKPNLKQRWWFGWACLPKVLLISMFTKIYKLLIKKHIPQECINKRLLPFIAKYHSNGNYLFWPDLTKAHYWNIVQQCLTEKNIPFVSRVDNAPNVLQARTIETMWTVLERKIYENNWQAENIDHLVKRIKQKAKELDYEMLQGIREDVGKKLRGMCRDGLYSVL